MPTDHDKLIELKDRITQLPLGEQLYLVELVLADYRHKIEEAQATLSAPIAACWEVERKKAA
jgi:hypothetical protein